MQEKESKSIDREPPSASLQILLGLGIVFVALYVGVRVVGRRPEYQPEIVYGTVISDGVVNSTRGATGPIYPVVWVRCEDGILVRIEITSYTPTEYKLEKGERVKLKRARDIALIPGFPSDEFSGWLESIEEASKATSNRGFLFHKIGTLFL